jgi:hypothetical protein
MKIIISENKLDGIIRSYIEKQLGPLIKKDEPYGNGNYYTKIGEFKPSPKSKKITAVLVKSPDGKIVIGIRKDIHDTIRSLFSLDIPEEYYKYVEDFIKDKFDIKVDHVLSFG